MLQALVGGMVTRYGLDGTKNSTLRVTVKPFNHWILVKKKSNKKIIIIIKNLHLSVDRSIFIKDCRW